MLKKQLLALTLLSSSLLSTGAMAGGFDELDKIQTLDEAMPYITKKIDSFYIGRTNDGSELSKKLYFSAVIMVTNGDTEKYLSIDDNDKQKLKEAVLIQLKEWLKPVELFNAMALIRQKEAEAVKIIILKNKNKS